MRFKLGFGSASFLVMVLFSGAVTGSAQTSIFSGPRDYVVGSYPESVVVADFNGDGRPDIATANQLSNNISILLQNSDGTFQPAVNYSVGKGPMWLQVGDVNNDGKPDLLVVNTTDNTLGVLLGNGDGTFQSQKLTTITGAPFPCVGVPAVGNCLAIGDFNGDGKLDAAIAVPLPISGTFGVAVLLGNGDGTFQPNPATYSLSLGPSALASADVNKDGKLDLVSVGSGLTVGSGGVVSVLLGNGDGTFQTAKNTPFPNPSGPIAGLVVADFNLDGNPDVATSSDNGFLNVLLGNGDGTFQTPIVGSNEIPLAAGDLNGDGKPDLICIGGGGASVLLGNGNGTFTAVQALTAPSVAGGISGVLGDLTGNQKLDFVMTDSGTLGASSTLPDIISVVNGNGDGTFATFPLYGGIPELNVVQPSIILGTLAVADFNRDGKVDLDVGIQYLAQVLPVETGEGLYLNAGNGAFSAPMTTTFTGGTFPFVIAADFRGNGRTDLASADSPDSNGVIAILLGNGDGTFQSEVDYGSGMLGPIAAGDFNNDGKLDVVGLFGFYGVGLAVLPGNGDGTFGFPVQTNTGSPSTLRTLAVADFNRDGKLDVATVVVGPAPLNAEEIQIFLGNGDGTFSAGSTYNVGPNPTAIASGDFNGDGIPDIVVGNPDGGLSAPSSIVVLLGNGDGTFKSPITTVAGNGIVALSVADFNLDRKADIAIINSGWSNVSVLLGNGDGTFQAPEQFYLGNSPIGSGLAVADFDGDGKPDISVTGVENISVLLSKGLSGPAALLGPSTLNLGSSVVGGTNTTAQQAVLSNSGSATISIGGVTISGAQQGDYKQTNTCGTTLAPGANCTISVTFVPQAGGTRTATLQVTDSAP